MYELKTLIKRSYKNQYFSTSPSSIAKKQKAHQIGGLSIFNLLKDSIELELLRALAVAVLAAVASASS